jgi:hypothetical protein
MSSVLFVAADAATTCVSFAAHQSLALANFYAGLLSKQEHRILDYCVLPLLLSASYLKQ